MSIPDVLANQRSWCVAIGHVLDLLGEIPDGVIHCSVSSPPYWALRSYLDDDHPSKADEIGSEKTLEEYLDKMVAVYHEVQRVLRPDGCCFVNIGDSYESSNVLGIPWRLAMALQADGWCLRMDVIWQKRSPMPESLNGWRWEKCRVKLTDGGSRTQKAGNAQPSGRANQDHSNGEWLGKVEYIPCPGCKKCEPNGGLVLRKGAWRPTKAHEYILQLAKSPQYFCDAQAVAEAMVSVGRSSGNKSRKVAVAGEKARVNTHLGISFPWTDSGNGRNPRSVWTFSTEPAAWDFCLVCQSLYQDSARSRIKTKEVPGDRPVRICPTCKSTDGWVDHFAIFPSALPEKCIRTSTSEKGCCPECGAQWARVIEKHRTATRPANKNAIDSTGKANRDPERHVTETVTIGWRPTCDCVSCGDEDLGGSGCTNSRPDPIPPLVLDPFSGSGRTIIAARRLNCRAIGIELNPAYAALSEMLICEDQPLFNT